MNDESLKSLYRRHTATRADASLDADALAQLLGRAGDADVEGTPLDRLATSPAQADIVRTALALAPDAQALSRDLGALRAPGVRPSARRGWLALAAGVGSAALLVTMLRDAPRPDALPDAPLAAESIMSASFEASVAAVDADAQPIFRADFDS
jgi:hypothetical protein